MKKKIAFSDLKSCYDLKDYLHDKATGLQNTSNKAPRYLCQYTNLTAAISIIQKKMWYLGSPLNMNDGLELSHAKSNVWKKIFFGSFMLEPKESIAMWSMYAQPWSEGVMIKIPVEKMKELVKSKPTIYRAQPDTKEADKSEVISDAEISFHAVAYTNADSKTATEHEWVGCGGETSECISGILTSCDLIGYVKDFAWSYENEYRLRVDVPSNTYRAVSVDLPDDFIDSLEIVSGPRFNGDLLSVIQSRVGNTVDKARVHKSLFDQKLNWVYCDSCRKSV